jgi:hypothetical protein
LIRPNKTHAKRLQIPCQRQTLPVPEIGTVIERTAPGPTESQLWTSLFHETEPLSTDAFLDVISARALLEFLF